MPPETQDLEENDFSEIKREINRYKAVSGSLRYSFKESDSVLLKVYSVFFILVSVFVTILFLLGLIANMGKVADAPPLGRIWGFFPFFVLLYLAIEGMFLLPIYLPMRRYRNKLKTRLE
ncbi:MAG: hypothetical protein ABEK59_08195 [Halobacteria archaeon]